MIYLKNFVLLPIKQLKGLTQGEQVLFFWLCYHAQNGKYNPSRQELADDCGLSTDSIDNNIKLLVEKKLIEKRNKIKHGGLLCNEYKIILRRIKTSGLPHQGEAVSTASTEGKTQVGESKKISAGELVNEVGEQKTYNKQVADLIYLFTQINPSVEYSNPFQRKAIEWLLYQTKYFLKAENTIKYALSVQGEKYAPMITTPLQLKAKIGELAVYRKKNQSLVAKIES